jgi:hypothetical protein
MRKDEITFHHEVPEAHDNDNKVVLGKGERRPLADSDAILLNLKLQFSMLLSPIVEHFIAIALHRSCLISRSLPWPWTRAFTHLYS